MVNSRGLVIYICLKSSTEVCKHLNIAMHIATMDDSRIFSVVSYIARYE